MPILFKSKKTKVSKRQQGGVIPFYAPYQVTFANTPVANPASLLKLYQASAPTGSGSSESKSSSADIKDDWKPKGLNNETQAAIDDVARYKTILHDGISKMGSGFIETTTGKELIRTIGEKEMQYEVVLANNQKDWENAFKDVTGTEKQGGSEYVYNGGLFLVEDLKTGDIAYKKPEEVFEEKTDKDGKALPQEYRPLKYAEAFEKRAQLPSTNTLFKNDLTTTLSKGRSVDYVFKTSVDPAFENIGKIIRENKTLNREGSYNDLEKIISEYNTGYRDENNKQALTEALNEVYTRLSQDDKDALMGKAWFTPSEFITKDKDGKVISKETRLPKSYNEASQVVSGWLYNNMSKRLVHEHGELEKVADVVNPRAVKDAKEGGGGSTELKQIGDLKTDFARHFATGSTDITEIASEEIFADAGNTNAVAMKLKEFNNNIKKNTILTFPSEKSEIFSTYGTSVANKVVTDNAAKKEDVEKRDENIPSGFVTYKELNTTNSPGRDNANAFQPHLKDAILENGNSLNQIDEEDKQNDIWFDMNTVKFSILPVHKGTNKVFKPSTAEERKHYGIDLYSKKIEELTKAYTDPTNKLFRTTKGELNQVAIQDAFKRINDQFKDELGKKGIELKPFYQLQARIKNTDDSVIKTVFKGVVQSDPNDPTKTSLESASWNSIDNFDFITNVFIPTPKLSTYDYIEGMKQWVEKEKVTLDYTDQSEKKMSNTLSLEKTPDFN